MRDTYHDELDAISRSLVEMANLVGSAMSRATTALLDGDLQLAEQVITADEAVDARYREVEARAFDLLARQQPVASDLRVLVTSLRMVADLERMGDNAAHVAKIARRRYPSSAVPPALRSTVLEMGHAAEEIVAKAGSVVAGRDIKLAAELEKDDDVMDELHRQLFTAILDDRWDQGVEAAIDITLVGRHGRAAPAVPMIGLSGDDHAVLAHPLSVTVCSNCMIAAGGGPSWADGRGPRAGARRPSRDRRPRGRCRRAPRRTGRGRPAPPPRTAGAGPTPSPPRGWTSLDARRR